MMTGAITIILGTGTNGRRIPGSMRRMNPGWIVITRIITIPTVMTAVRNMRILKIRLITLLMRTTAMMTAAGTMTAGTPAGIRATAGTPVTMTGDLTGKM